MGARVRVRVSMWKAILGCWGVPVTDPVAAPITAAQTIFLGTPERVGRRLRSSISVLVRLPPPNLPPYLEAAAIATYQELLILCAPPHHPSPTASTTPSKFSHVATVERRLTNDPLDLAAATVSASASALAMVLVSTRRARGTWKRAASSSRALRER